jgi:pyridoxamine 5'-phosphate oxidase
VDNPLALFSAWFEEATRSGLRHPNAMTLATVGSDGRPSARMVLL